MRTHTTHEHTQTNAHAHQALRHGGLDVGLGERADQLADGQAVAGAQRVQKRDSMELCRGWLQANV